MSTRPPVTVRIVRRFTASAERVFDAWLDPVRAAKWLFATDGGKMVKAEIDPRVGGKWTFTEQRGDQLAEHTGQYLVIERPRRLVFTFGVPAASPDFDRVEVEIAPIGRGCELVLTHTMKPEWAEYRDRTEGGWTHLVEGLATSLGDKPFNAFPGQRTAPGEIRLERLLPGPIERVWAYLTEPEKRARWLASGPMELSVGGKVGLFFKHSELPGSGADAPPAKYAMMTDGAHQPCVITRCEPPRTLAYTWGDDGSEVTFELIPLGKQIRLTVIHRRLPDGDAMLSTASGWHAHLDLLIAELSSTPHPSFWPNHTALEALYARELATVP